MLTLDNNAYNSENSTMSVEKTAIHVLLTVFIFVVIVTTTTVTVTKYYYYWKHFNHYHSCLFWRQ